MVPAVNITTIPPTVDKPSQVNDRKPILDLPASDKANINQLVSDKSGLDKPSAQDGLINKPLTDSPNVYKPAVASTEPRSDALGSDKPIGDKLSVASEVLPSGATMKEKFNLAQPSLDQPISTSPRSIKVEAPSTSSGTSGNSS